ncbi:MAG: hypothetical protein HAW60_06185 [Bdellovibrionales bacterium]|nr:hypothetical protein [Bdellovibrionales bacterium]
MLVTALLGILFALQYYREKQLRAKDKVAWYDKNKSNLDWFKLIITGHQVRYEDLRKGWNSLTDDLSLYILFLENETKE